MAIVTRNPYTKFVCVGNSESLVFENNATPEKNYPMAFEVNFSDSATPATQQVTIYNLSRDHSSFFKKGYKCYLYFCYGSDPKLISEGYISKIGTTQHDGTTNTKVLSFTEGTDYSNVQARKMKFKKEKKVKKTKTIKKKKAGHWKKTRTAYYVTETYKAGKKKGQKHRVRKWKHGRKWQKGKTVNHHVRYRSTKTVLVNKVFHKGTSYKKVIEGVAAQAKIHISRLQLAKNPSLKRPYTAKGKPLNLLKQLVVKTESKLEYVNGKLEILDPKSFKRTWYDIDDTDLIQPPTCNESDDGKTDTWEINTPLVPEITTNVGILMQSKYLKGRFYVKSGQHTFDGDSYQTQCSLIAM